MPFPLPDRCRRSPSTRTHLELLTALGFLLGAASPADALVLTLLSSEANVSGSLSDDDESWSDADQSFDPDPNIQVSQSFSTNTSSNTFVDAAHLLGANSLRVSSRSTAGSGGLLSDSASAHDFAIRFSIDEPAHYELENGNSTGNFPVAIATTAGTSASLVYELRREDTGVLVFSWSAPSSGEAGVYASGFIPAGTYVWTATASAVANGNPCCGAQSAAALGNTRLSLDSSFTSVPGLGPLTGALLAAVLGGAGAWRLRRGARPGCDAPAGGPADAA
jgi:hypothetical protein